MNHRVKEHIEHYLPFALWALIAAVTLFALSAYIKKEVADSGRAFLPFVTWQQWAQERGEWRGKVDEKLDMMEKQRVTDREEFIKRLGDFDRKLDRLLFMFEFHLGTNSFLKPVSVSGGASW